MRSLCAGVLLWALLFFGEAAAQPLAAETAAETPTKAATNSPSPKPSLTQSEALWETYEALKKSSGDIPQEAGEVYEWLKQDIQNLSSWEYHTALLPASPVELSEQLNRLGAERWECIQIIARENQLLAIFKRPSKSYVRNLPMRELLKALGTFQN